MTPVDQTKACLLAVSAIAGGQKMLSKGAHIPHATLSRRISCPEDITVGELTRICRYAAGIGVKVEVSINIQTQS